MFFWAFGSVDGSTDVASGYAATPGQWEHWVFAYDAGVVVMYRNGAEVARASRAVDTAPGPLTIGRPPVSPGDLAPAGLVGAVDEVRVYARALAAADVARLYDVTSP